MAIFIRKDSFPGTRKPFVASQDVGGIQDRPEHNSYDGGGERLM